LSIRSNRISRRRTLQALAALTGCLPLRAVLAQSGKNPLPVIGLLTATRLDERELESIRLGLKDMGFSPGTNVQIDHWSADGQYDRLPALAKDLVRRPLGLIIAIGGTVAALEVKKATETTPILFATAGDPVKLGLVSSLSRPGANLTGITFLGSGLSGKRLQILREMIPAARSVAFLINPANPNLASERREVEAAAEALGERLLVETAGDAAQIDTAFARFAEQRVDGVLIAADAVYTSRRQQVTALATRYRLATIYADLEFVAAGGLVSYGASRREAYRLVGRYAGRILKGERPAELPVQQSTKVDLAVNLTAAKILGLKLSSNFLARADEVIE